MNTNYFRSLSENLISDVLFLFYLFKINYFQDKCRSMTLMTPYLKYCRICLHIFIMVSIRRYKFKKFSPTEQKNGQMVNLGAVTIAGADSASTAVQKENNFYFI